MPAARAATLAKAKAHYSASCLGNGATVCFIRIFFGTPGCERERERGGKTAGREPGSAPTHRRASGKHQSHKAAGDSSHTDSNLLHGNSPSRESSAATATGDGAHPLR